MNKEVGFGINAKVSLDTSSARAEAQALSKEIGVIGKTSSDTARALSGMKDAASESASSLAQELRRTLEDLRQQRQVIPGGVIQNFSRAASIVQGIGPSIAGATSGPEIGRLDARLNSAQTYLEQAHDAGFAPERTEELQKHLDALRHALDGARKATEDSTRKTEAGPGASPFPDASGASPSALSNVADKLLRRFSGAGLSNLGMLGTVAGELGPVALGGTAVIGGFNWMTDSLQKGNQSARDQAVAAADLARMYGYSGNANRLFRDEQGFTDPRIAKYGFSALDAARTSAGYDLPGGMRDDVTNILGFSRVTGLEEGRVASVARSLGQAGAFKPGESGAVMGSLRTELAEGLKLGLSQSDVMRTIQSTVEANYRRGMLSTPTSVAFQASLMNAFAGTRNRALMGDAGAQAAQGVTGLITGQGDPGLEMLAMNNLGEYTAADLGLSGPEARQFENLRRQSPMQANRMALELVTAGRSPVLAKRLASNLEQQTGGRGSLIMDMLLKQSGLGADQRLALEANGIGNLYQKGQQGTAAIRDAGADAINRDPQANNQLERRTRALAVADSDMNAILEMAKVSLTGTAEEYLRGIRRGAQQALANVMQGLSGASPFAPANYGGTVADYAFAPTSPAAPGNYFSSGQGTNLTDTLKFISGGRRSTVTQDPGENAGNPGKFGYGPKGHSGYDVAISGGEGAPVYNPFPNAKVIVAGHDPSEPYFGNVVKLKLQDGATAVFGHLADVLVSAGSSIGRGQLLGHEGKTGSATGPHLHFELRPPDAGIGEAFRDPAAFSAELSRATATSESAKTAFVGAGGADRAFARTELGQTFMRRLPIELGRKNFNPDDPIPDDVAKGGPKAIQAWAARITKGNPASQRDLEDFLRQLNLYQNEQHALQGQTGQGRIQPAPAIQVNLPSNLGVNITRMDPAVARQIAAATAGQRVTVTPVPKNKAGP